MVAALVHAVDAQLRDFFADPSCPQFAAKMFPPKGGRVAFSRTALHQVPNAILGVLRNVIA